MIITYARIVMVYTERVTNKVIPRILCLWHCSRYFHQIYKIYRIWFTAHILQISLK